MKFINKAQWIWTDPQDKSPDIYRLFRKDFVYTAAQEKVTLEIAVCSTFEIRINGIRVSGQQLSDYPDSPTGSVLDVTPFVKEGANTLLLQVHYIGDDFLTGLAGTPFVKAALSVGEKLLFVSDNSWNCCADPRYHDGLCCKVTPQLGFAFEYFSEKDPLPDNWKNAVEVNGLFDGITVKKRSVPQLNELEKQPVQVVQTGVFSRTIEAETFAASCMTDAMIPVPLTDFAGGEQKNWPVKYYHKNFELQPDKSNPLEINVHGEYPPFNGVYVILDTGREQVGYLTFDLTAPAGTVIDICHGEHLDSGRVGSRIEKRNFTDRYICRAGENKFTYRHRRLGGRYIELHILTTQPVTLNYCGLIPLELPVPPEAAFACEDRILVKNRELAIRTLHLCMHEHYEDCPWREQALYGYDSRNQMLYGYYTWGNYDFAASSIDLLGKSFDGDRYFSLSAPGRLASRTIPIFTLIWITELLEYQLFSGSSQLFTKWQSLVDRILDTALTHKVPGHEDFYHPGTDKHIWNFCEWNNRLASVTEHPSSTYNVYLYEALLAAAKLHTFAGNAARAGELHQTAEKLGTALKKYFWSDQLGVFLLSQNDGTQEEYEHVQAVFLANGLGEEHKDALLSQIFSRSLLGISFSGLPYFVKALHDSNAAGRKYLYDYLDELLTPMLLAGATSLWETADGSLAFNRAGSLCHAWSSVMPYYCGGKLLGVTPLEPGFARFEVKPYCGKLTHASGEIPTPWGFIKVSWTLRDGAIDLEVIHPEGTMPEISSFEEFPIRLKKIQKRSGV